MQKVHSARSACRKMTNERREEGKGIYLRWWSWMAELTMVLVTVLGGGDGETQWQQRGFRCVEIPIGVLFPRRFYPFYPFSSFSPTVSLSLRVDIPGFFWFLLSRSVSLSLGWFLSPFAAVFFLFFFLLRSGGIYRGRGSGVDPASSHRCPCMGRTSPAPLRRRLRWPMVASLARHDFSAFSSWGGASGVRFWLYRARGEEEPRGRKRNFFFPCCTSRGRRRRNSAASKRHRFVPPFFFCKRMKRRRFD